MKHKAHQAQFENQKSLPVPRQLWDEMVLALDQATERLRVHTGNIGLEPAQVESRKVADFAARVLQDARDYYEAEDRREAV